MRGEWRSLIGIPQCIDCLDLMRQLPDGVVKLIFADPDYNIGVFRKMPHADYLAWCESWIAEASRVLAPNGALWVSHSKPRVLTDISRIIEKYGRGMVNWITLDKYNGNPFRQAAGTSMYCKTLYKGLRSFQRFEEYLIWHTDGQALGKRISLAREAAGLRGTDIDIALGYVRSKDPSRGTELCRRWEEGLSIPKEGDFVRVLEVCNVDAEPDYEHLRYVFRNPGKVSSVWQIPPAPRTWHPTPKPEALLERIILATSNEGDLVVDFFGGSFTTMQVCHRLNRRCISGDICADYVEWARAELAQPRQVEMIL